MRFQCFFSYHQNADNTIFDRYVFGAPLMLTTNAMPLDFSWQLFMLVYTACSSVLQCSLTLVRMFYSLLFLPHALVSGVILLPFSFQFPP